MLTEVVCPRCRATAYATAMQGAPESYVAACTSGCDLVFSDKVCAKRCGRYAQMFCPDCDDFLCGDHARTVSGYCAQHARARGLVGGRTGKRRGNSGWRGHGARYGR